MHFLKYINKQAQDPRCRSYYIYVCNCCKHEEQFWWVPNFDTNRLRRCPKCKIEDDTSDLESLIKRKSQLEQLITTRTDELKAYNSELLSVSAKLEIELKKIPKQIPAAVGT